MKGRTMKGAHANPIVIVGRCDDDDDDDGTIANRLIINFIVEIALCCNATYITGGPV